MTIPFSVGISSFFYAWYEENRILFPEDFSFMELMSKTRGHWLHRTSGPREGIKRVPINPQGFWFRDREAQLVEVVVYRRDVLEELGFRNEAGFPFEEWNIMGVLTHPEPSPCINSLELFLSEQLGDPRI